MNNTEQYIKIIQTFATEFIPSCIVRNNKTFEVIGTCTEWDLNDPIIRWSERELNYKFMGAEAKWILTGSSQVSQLVPYCQRMLSFSDDGIHLSGAYGPKFVSQVRYVLETLKKDPNSRQAVMSFWERNPMPSKDIPCTSIMQFLIRDYRLHVIVYMRSSDVWLGLPYDIFSFSMMARYIASQLTIRDTLSAISRRPDLGTLSIMAGSQHFYEENQNAARKALNIGMTEFSMHPHACECMNDLSFNPDASVGFMTFIDNLKNFGKSYVSQSSTVPPVKQVEVPNKLSCCTGGADLSNRHGDE